MNKDKVKIVEVRKETNEIVVEVVFNGIAYPSVLPILAVNSKDVAVLKAQIKKLAKDLRQDLQAIKDAVAVDPSAPVEVSPEAEALAGEEIELDDEVPTDGGTTPPDDGSSTATPDGSDSTSTAEPTEPTV